MSLVPIMDSFTKLGLPPIFRPPVSNASLSNASSPSSSSSSSFTAPAGSIGETGGSGSGATGGSSGGSPFPAGMMDTFLFTAGQASPLMQLLLFLYRLLGAQFGLDPSVVLTMLGFLWGLSKIASQVHEYAGALVDRHFMCAMFVSEDDHIYSHLMKWLSHQPAIRNNQYLMAQTVWKSAWEEEDEELEGELVWTDGGEGGGGEKKYLNFSSLAARSSPRFVPAMGSTAFWHKGTYFRVHRKKESFVNTHAWGGPMKDLEEIRISCFGRSIDPIKQLLADAKALYYNDTDQKTTIYRPRAKEQRRDYNMWQQVARRPVRPMSTVVLDSKEKHDVLADINEYLHPLTPRWYACRGIPLRRGYLFHGPPGTGKTSFSFALAGVFGIDIYVVSLQDVNVTEEDLASLFTKLPRRCIILLEDIDSAGLRRDAKSGLEDKEGKEEKDEESKGEKDDKKKKDKKKNKENKKEKREKDADSGSDTDGDTDSDGEETRRPKKWRHRGKRDRSKNNSNMTPESISLSGLLNAIDGVASHEGRVLIMTTNKPEALDEALIRPGRVDVQVSFTNATSTQAGELFHRMYEASQPKEALPTAKALLDKLAEMTGEKQDPAAGEGEEELEGVTAEEMKAIADEFGRRISEGMFSAAEIQGFLLKRKKCPRKALEDVAGWVEASLRQKESNSKVSTVQ